MTDRAKHFVGVGAALALYIGGAFVGALGAFMTIGMGIVAVFWGAPLVTEIIVSAIVSAIGLTIADVGRKRFHVLLPTTHRYITTSMAKQAG